MSVDDDKKIEIIRGEAGRPTLYRVEMCERLVDLMAQGKTDTQVCAILGISMDSLAKYRRIHPEMAEAYARGHILQKAWWENLGMGLATGEVKGNATVYCFIMGNKFREDYSHKEGNININVGKNDIAIINDDELKDRIKQLSHLLPEDAQCP